MKHTGEQARAKWKTGIAAIACLLPLGFSGCISTGVVNSAKPQLQNDVLIVEQAYLNPGGGILLDINAPCLGGKYRSVDVCLSVQKDKIPGFPIRMAGSSDSFQNFGHLMCCPREVIHAGHSADALRKAGKFETLEFRNALRPGDGRRRKARRLGRSRGTSAVLYTSYGSGSPRCQEFLLIDQERHALAFRIQQASNAWPVAKLALLPLTTPVDLITFPVVYPAAKSLGNALQ